MITDRRRRADDAGFISAELLIAVAISLVFFVFLCNFIFIQYGKGVIRAAADEGARAGSRVDTSEVVCRNRAEDLLDSLGAMATNPTITCVINPATQRITATVDVTFEPWMPLMPVISGHAVGTSLKEEAPQ